MDRHEWRPQQGLDLAEVAPGERSAVPSPDAGRLDHPAGRDHGPVEAEAAQRQDRVCLNGEPGADLPDLGRPLQDLDREPGPAERNGGAQTSDSTAGNEDRRAHLGPESSQECATRPDGAEARRGLSDLSRILAERSESGGSVPRGRNVGNPAYAAS